MLPEGASRFKLASKAFSIFEAAPPSFIFIRTRFYMKKSQDGTTA
jgi:hypothetical protein